MLSNNLHLVSLILLFAIVRAADNNDFDYTDVLQWNKKDAQCGSLKRQSPVNLATNGPESNFIQKFQVGGTNGSNALDISGFLKNSSSNEFPFGISSDGDSISVNLTSAEFKVKFQNKTYTAQQFHLHSPSEHRLENKWFPLDAHFVSSTKDKKEFSVIGVFFEVVPKSELKQPEGSKLIQSVIEAITKSNSSTNTTGNSTASSPKAINGKGKFDVSAFFKTELNGLEGAEFSAYEGSLTTPPCSEVVQWLHLHQPVQISLEQWNKMKDFLKFSSRALVPRKLNSTSSANTTQTTLTNSTKLDDSKNMTIPLPSGPSEGNGTLANNTVSEKVIYEFKRRFTYSTFNGSHEWEKVIPLCGNGKKQSPVDFSKNQSSFFQTVKGADTLKLEKWEMVNQVKIVRSQRLGTRLSLVKIPDTSVRPRVTFDGEKYRMGSVFIRTISEHRIEGDYFGMEVQFFHRTPGGKKQIMVSFLFDVVEDSQKDVLGGVVKFVSEASKPGAARNGTTDLDLTPFADQIQSSEFFVYNGSLTTPPCDEGIKWFVAKNPMKIGLAEWKILAYSYNARPVMPRK